MLTVEGIAAAVLSCVSSVASSSVGVLRARSTCESAILMSRNHDWSAVRCQVSKSSMALSRLCFLRIYLTLCALTSTPWLMLGCGGWCLTSRRSMSVTTSSLLRRTRSVCSQISR
ncbi:hypothetical protein B0T21DRAFT_372115 [Apiosordaria backusii]|uniref:Uncharacterized protein n=1 Tax=Apiosordaria backusii TaxID=314023 RepID=A0AA40E5X7_9PEZI|nr:hypothetical protein B0T21DRAFT_372115 [Apiosordaria backusii]